MSAKIQTPQTNYLLVALPKKVRQNFIETCELVELAFAEVLYEPDEPLQYAYFPIDSYISQVKPIDDHTGLEVSLVGNEGMHGIGLALGVSLSLSHAVVQGEGLAMRMRAAPFRQVLHKSPLIQQLMYRYIYVRISQLEQTAACIRYHVLQARLARWLLMTHDRANSDELHITQEFLSFMLGVRRVGINKAAGALQKRKLIRYHRGKITVLNRHGLETASCSCYEADITIYSRILC